MLMKTIEYDPIIIYNQKAILKYDSYQSFYSRVIEGNVPSRFYYVQPLSSILLYIQLLSNEKP